MEKKKYYISVGAKEISQIQDASPYEFEIEATDEEIKQLREMFDGAHSEDWKGFLRSHAPYVQYHQDKENDLYDKNVYQAYKLLYDLGTQETRDHIISMGVLND